MNVYEAADNYNADGQEVSGTIHLPAAARVGGPGGWGGTVEELVVLVGYTLLRNSPPDWCSGVLHSEEFLALSLLVFGSLSLMMSY